MITLKDPIDLKELHQFIVCDRFESIVVWIEEQKYRILFDEDGRNKNDNRLSVYLVENNTSIYGNAAVFREDGELNGLEEKDIEAIKRLIVRLPWIGEIIRIRSEL